MYERILVPVDGSATSDRGLREAIDLARLTGARIRLMHVVDVLSLALAGQGYVVGSGDLLGELRRTGEALLGRAAQDVEAAGVKVDTVLHENASGRVSELVADEAAKWHAGLIVCGTHGRRGMGRLVLGSDAEQIVRLAPVPVMLVRERPAGGGS